MKKRSEYFRLENDLLVCCARVYLDSKNADRIRELLYEKLDWGYLLQTAFNHGLMPLLYRQLNAACQKAIPEKVKEQLENYFHNNARHNLLLTGELLKLLAMFDAHEIDAIPYKGPVFAASVYGNVALRQIRDLDILVHKRDVMRIKKLLVSHGYTPIMHMTGAQEAHYLKNSCEYIFLSDNGRVCLEIHWDIFPKFFSISFNYENLKKPLKQVILSGTVVLSFQPEDLIQIFCIHGAKHFWERFEWICGISELIRGQQDMDWEWALKQGRECGIERILYLGLYLASEMLQAKVPPDVLKRVVSDKAVKLLAEEVKERLFSKTGDQPKMFERSLFRPFLFHIRERRRDRIQYFFRSIMIPTADDWKSLPLPDRFFFLYYLLRPIRLAGKYILRLRRHPVRCLAL